MQLSLKDTPDIWRGKPDLRFAVQGSKQELKELL